MMGPCKRQEVSRGLVYMPDLVYMTPGCPGTTTARPGSDDVWDLATWSHRPVKAPTAHDGAEARCPWTSQQAPRDTEGRGRQRQRFSHLSGWEGQGHPRLGNINLWSVGTTVAGEPLEENLGLLAKLMIRNKRGVTWYPELGALFPLPTFIIYSG